MNTNGISKDDILGTSGKPIGFTASDKLDETYEQFETALPNGLGKLESFIKQLKTYQSEIYRRFFPKIYTQTGAFADWRIASATAAALHMTARSHREFVQHYQAYVNFVAWSLLWEQYQCPTFFVSAKFLDAMMNTAIPDVFDLSEFKLPFPAMNFVFPKNNRMKFKGRSLSHVGIAHINKSIHTDLGDVEAVGNRNKIVVATSLFPKAFFATGIRFDGLGEIVAMKVEDFAERNHRAGSMTYTPEHDAELVLLMTRLAVNFVLAMESRPALIDKGVRVSNPQTRNGKSIPAIWSPNLLGARYQTVTQDLGGTHASPRAHWRRGHFRHQRFGSSACAVANCKHPQSVHIGGDVCEIPNCDCRKYVSGFEYRTIWIEPVLVNALAY